MVTLLSYFSAILLDLATHSIGNELIDTAARARYKKQQELVGLRTCPYELGLEA